MFPFLQSIFFIFLVVFLMLCGLVISRLKGESREIKETLLNIIIFIVGIGIQVYLISSIQSSFYERFAGYTLFRLEENFWTWCLAFLAVDFIYYWRHRWEHSVPLLWAEHSVHHSSSEFNLSTAGRLSWIMICCAWITYLPLVVLGFSISQLVSAWTLNMSFQFISHLAMTRPIPVLDYVLNTPRNHCLHHGKSREYEYCNFSGTLMIWDRLFGTYKGYSGPVIYGCIPEIESSNPLIVNFRPMLSYLKSQLLNRRKNF